MTSRDKRFAKIILGREREYPYDWIKNFLEYYGFKGQQIASSHVTFRKDNYAPINIVVHHNRVKRIYVKKMLKKLKENQIL